MASDSKQRNGLRLSHLGTDGAARMVDVSAKPDAERMARAESWVRVGPKIATTLRESGAIAKGNVLETARIAGIMAAKRTAELIPMCHPLSLDVVEVDAQLVEDQVRLLATVHCTGKTGVEMEAITAVTVAALTIYDMCKSADKGIEVTSIRLREKSGGKSGHWKVDGDG